MEPLKKTVFLLGPTASGKTSLLTSLELSFVEVVSCDALQLYRDAKIGSAAPTPEEQEALPYHMLGILGAQEALSSARFGELAEKEIAQIHKRCHVALITAGAPFYVKELLYPQKSSLPQNSKIESEMARQAERAQKLGLEPLQKELEEVDPGCSFPLADRYRVTRALAVYKVLGKPYSSFQQEWPERRENSAVLQIEWDRAELHSRINKRSRALFEGGALAAETRALRAIDPDLTSPIWRGIGYKQMVRMPEASEDEQEKEIAKCTRRYAKQQITFFKKFKIDQKITMALGSENALQALRESCYAAREEI